MLKALKGTEKTASALAYGTTGASCRGDFERSAEEYELAYEKGFRIFDTAYSYDRGEESLGRWLQKSGHREDVILLDKGCNPCAAYTKPDAFDRTTIWTQLHTSLERLQTEYVDLYILHRDDPAKPVDEIVEVLNELKDEGKIHRFGGSNWTMKRIQEANAYAEAHGLEGFTVCSPNYTYVIPNGDPWGGSVTLCGEQNRPFRAFLSENQMPIFAYSALARGFLSGKYHSDNRIPIEKCIGEAPILEFYTEENVRRLSRVEKVAAEHGATVPQIALAWMLAQPLNLYPITAPTGEKHMQEAVDALRIRLTQEQIDFLNEAV